MPGAFGHAVYILTISTVLYFFIVYSSFITNKFSCLKTLVYSVYFWSQLRNKGGGGREESNSRSTFYSVLFSWKNSVKIDADFGRILSFWAHQSYRFPVTSKRLCGWLPRQPFLYLVRRFVRWLFVQLNLSDTLTTPNHPCWWFMTRQERVGPEGHLCLVL